MPSDPSIQSQISQVEAQIHEGPRSGARESDGFIQRLRIQLSGLYAMRNHNERQSQNLFTRAGSLISAGTSTLDVYPFQTPTSNVESYFNAKPIDRKALSPKRASVLPSDRFELEGVAATGRWSKPNLPLYVDVDIAGEPIRISNPKGITPEYIQAYSRQYIRDYRPDVDKRLNTVERLIETARANKDGVSLADLKTRKANLLRHGTPTGSVSGDSEDPGSIESLDEEAQGLQLLADNNIGPYENAATAAKWLMNSPLGPSPIGQALGMKVSKLLDDAQTRYNEDGTGIKPIDFVTHLGGNLIFSTIKGTNDLISNPQNSSLYTVITNPQGYNDQVTVNALEGAQNVNQGRYWDAAQNAANFSGQVVGPGLDALAVYDLMHPALNGMHPKVAGPFDGMSPSKFESLRRGDSVSAPAISPPAAEKFGANSSPNYRPITLNEIQDSLGAKSKNGSWVDTHVREKPDWRLMPGAGSPLDITLRDLNVSFRNGWADHANSSGLPKQQRLEAIAKLGEYDRAIQNGRIHPDVIEAMKPPNLIDYLKRSEAPPSAGLFVEQAPSEIRALPERQEWRKRDANIFDGLFDTKDRDVDGGPLLGGHPVVRLPSERISFDKNGNLIGDDGRSINVHHGIYGGEYRFMEMTFTDHMSNGNFNKNHPGGKGPAEYDGPTYDKYRKRYGRDRWHRSRCSLRMIRWY